MVSLMYAVGPATGSAPTFYYLDLDCLSSTHCTDGLIGLSLRWIQPIQQHGRRIPSLSSEITRLTCSSRVFCCLTVIVQQIHSLRASGVRSSQRPRADSSASNAFRKSAGSLCTTPSEIFVAIGIFYISGLGSP